MCKYCNEQDFTLLAPRMLQGKNMSETYGDICLEKTNDQFYISADCFEHHHSETYTINYCPMCGRDLKETKNHVLTFDEGGIYELSEEEQVEETKGDADVNI